MFTEVLAGAVQKHGGGDQAFRATYADGLRPAWAAVRRGRLTAPAIALP